MILESYPIAEPISCLYLNQPPGKLNEDGQQMAVLQLPSGDQPCLITRGSRGYLVSIWWPFSAFFLDNKKLDQKLDSTATGRSGDGRSPYWCGYIQHLVQYLVPPCWFGRPEAEPPDLSPGHPSWCKHVPEMARGMVTQCQNSTEGWHGTMMDDDGRWRGANVAWKKRSGTSAWRGEGASIILVSVVDSCRSCRSTGRPCSFQWIGTTSSKIFIFTMRHLPNDLLKLVNWWKCFSKQQVYKRCSNFEWGIFLMSFLSILFKCYWNWDSVVSIC